MDRAVFYDEVRNDRDLFGGRLNQGQVDGKDFEQALVKASASA